jgi:hypothetical protein
MVRSTICSLSCLSILGLLISPNITKAEEKKCECKFPDNTWQAYGTNQACSAFLRSAQSCEVAFGGLGADERLIVEVLGRTPESYRREVYRILVQYLQALSEDDIEALTEPDFMGQALPTFMRGAFLREIEISEATRINVLVEEFIESRIQEIANVFRAQQKNFVETKEEAKFEVGSGWIIMEYQNRYLVLSYISENQT